MFSLLWRLNIRCLPLSWPPFATCYCHSQLFILFQESLNFYFLLHEKLIYAADLLVLSRDEASLVHYIGWDLRRWGARVRRSELAGSISLNYPSQLEIFIIEDLILGEKLLNIFLITLVYTLDLTDFKFGLGLAALD